MFARKRLDGMRTRLGKAHFWLGGLIGGIALALTAAAQTPPPAGKVEPLPPPGTNSVAATVNGQPILEIAVYRSLLRENPANRDQARLEVLHYLIDNVVVDQYLTQLKIQVEAKEIEDRLAQIKDEAKKSKQDFEDILKKLLLSEADLRKELASALRWDKFVLQQGTDKVLKDMFDKNKNMFDGSLVQARHILIEAKGDAAKDAQAKLLALRKQIEDEAAQAAGTLPAGTDNLTREKERQKALDKAFAAAAMKESSCPSKKQGGELGWFPRIGAMVEPFARAAFALKPYQISEPVTTEFGVHLIMPTDAKPGKDVKFEEVRPFVLEVYGDRLREAILAAYKPRSKIEIHPAPKADKK